MALNRSALKRTEFKGRRKPLKRTELRSRPKRNPTLAAARTEVQARSEGLCEVRGPQCTNKGTQAHHRCRSDRRRNVHLPERMLWLCRWCHLDYVHANPELSYERGWLIRNGVAS